MSFLPQIFGVILIGSGVFAIFRRSTNASAEGEDEREFRGVSAVALGVLWIIVGIAFLLFPSVML